MDKADIPEDEWMAKRKALAAEHDLPGARKQLMQGFKDWLQTDMFKTRQAKAVPAQKSTQAIAHDD